ncbi:alpha-amylase family glycosyl hydrolase [Paraflavitalea sp. CAU 1676]|uniref:alpha-amylase family glycosyl hydrolase n=1 Tax=Paraflavitalea sp. CAU 1676 TaxID=3032598 RepID=UPI0023DAFD40|nr:alpha-amylase family glycosyl hydrolase [Paraflavitalea sp. CAU 1676]MDF2190124.1 alpha-amylase family glycosyl hydrolase [Paraflavitalea sp. CAU 1676]
MKQVSLGCIAFVCLVAAILPSCKLMPKEEPKKEAVRKDTVFMAGPDWFYQSNIYEVNVRQYTPEGTFKAFAASLPRLKQMGVDILWFMPVTPISKTDRKGTLGSYYAVADYQAVNPEFGTMADFKALVQEAHNSGFKVIIDWVANHTGADHPWLIRHPDFYNRDSTGKALFAFDWSDTRVLNYNNQEMRDSMIAAMKYWVREADIDGYRCDIAGEVPTDFWKECIRQLRQDKRLFMLAEGEKAALHAAGFDASYLWDMFHTMKKVAAGERTALSFDTVLRRQDSAFPKGAVRLYFTSNHDENSWNKSDFGTFPGLKHAPFAVLTQTMQASLPLIYSGQEEPVLRAISFFEKDNMGFKQYGRASFYKTLLDLRKRNPALATDAAFKRVSVGDDKALYAYVREKGAGKVLVILNLSNKEQVVTIKDQSLVGQPTNLFLGSKEPFTLNHSFNIEPWGYIVCEY